MNPFSANTGTLRIAIVQLDFNAAYVAGGVDFLEEPYVPLGRGAYPHLLTSLTLEDPAAVGEVVSWRNLVKQAYLNLLRVKLRQVVRICKRQHADLVIFPEYSIPPECLPPIARQAPEQTTICGSHTVVRSSFSIYRSLGIKDAGREGKASCFVLSPGNTPAQVDKFRKSAYEQALEPGEKADLVFVRCGSSVVPVVVSICADFIDHAVFSDRKSQAESQLSPAPEFWIYAVPAHTPVVDDFDLRAQKLMGEELQRRAKRADIVIVFCNSAQAGGSRVYFDNRDMPGILDDRTGSFTLPPGEESVLVCEVAFREGSSNRGGFSKFPVQVLQMRTIGAIPLWYWDSGADYAVLRKLSRQRPSELPTAARQQLDAIRTSGLPAVLKEKFRMLARKPPTEEAVRLLSMVAIAPSELPTVAEWRLQWLGATIDFLRTLSDRPGLSSADRGKVGCLLGAYGSLLRQLGPLHRATQPLEALRRNLAPYKFHEPAMGIASRVVATPSSGAAERELCEWLQWYIRTRQTLTAEARRHIEQVVDGVAAARPYPAVDVAELVHGCLAMGGEARKAILDAIARRIEERRREWDLLFNNICELGLLGAARRVALVGTSETLMAILFALPEEMRARLRVGVIGVTNKFGSNLALDAGKALVGAGYHLDLIMEGSFARYLSEPGVDLLLVGFNLYTDTHIVNSAGSLEKIELAKLNGDETAAVGLSYKKWTNDRLASHIQEIRGNIRIATFSDELRDDLGPDCELVNYSYDVFPLAQLHFLITDEGIKKCQVARSDVAQ